MWRFFVKSIACRQAWMMVDRQRRTPSPPISAKLIIPEPAALSCLFGFGDSLPRLSGDRMWRRWVSARPLRRGAGRASGLRAGGPGFVSPAFCRVRGGRLISGGRSARSAGYGRHVVKEILGPIPVRASIGRERRARNDPGCSRVGTGRGDGDPMQHVSRRRNRRHPPHNRYGAQGGAEFVKRSCVYVRAANRCSRFRILRAVRSRKDCCSGVRRGEAPSNRW
jgi:hypothetical protein